MNSSNKHLKSIIQQMNNFKNAQNTPPEDLYHEFIMELRLSQLFIPAIFENEGISFEHLESEDGMMVIPLFTDPDQYTGDAQLECFVFEFYAEIISDMGFAGVLINPESDEVYVPSIVTDKLRAREQKEIDESEILDAEELKSLALSVKNENLLSFIKDDSNFNNFDGLIGVLSDSVLLNVASSHEDLESLSRDGVLSTVEVGGFNLTIKTVGQERFALLFSDIERIRETCDTSSGLSYYCQVASDKIYEYILINDLDGIIINPYVEDYRVPRYVLLDIYENHPEIFDKPKLAAATFYAFTL